MIGSSRASTTRKRRSRSLQRNAQALEVLEHRVQLSATGAGQAFDIFAFAVPLPGDRLTFDGMSFPGDSNDPEGSARTLLSIVDPETQFELIEVKHGLASSHARFQQVIDGLPVFGSAVSVHQGPDGVIQTLHLETFPNASTQNAFTTTLSQAAAIDAAEHAVGVAKAYSPPTASMVWYPNQAGQTLLAWEVNVSSLQPVGEYQTVINAATGEVLFKNNRLTFATGAGDVFDPNPYQTQGSGAGLSDSDDATSGALEAQMVPVALQRLNDNTGLLIGEWVDVATLNSPTLANLDADEPNRVYNYTRDDDRFEQVVIYHAIDSIQQYFHTLGFDDDAGVANGIRDFPTQANAHWDNADNSFYSPGNDALHFGDGGVDDAEDADIVAHEYGHAVQHDQNANWGGGEMGAMGEGFGDYLAASFYATAGDAAFQTAHAACVGEWDATAYSSSDPPCLRRVDGDKMYPDDLTGAIHGDGEIWSAALWDIRTALGATITDTLVLEHHFALPANATMPDAAQALLAADTNINGGENQDAIRQAFIDRGILNQGPAGRVAFDADTYGIGDVITVSVGDTDLLGGGPIEVTVQSSGGDAELVTLTEVAGEFTGTITTSAAAVIASDGILQLVSGEQVTVIYVDADNGQGSSVTVTDTANVVQYTEIAAFDFSDDVGLAFDEGFTTSGTANEWHLSTGRGNDPGHTADDSFYFGSGEGSGGGGSHADDANGTITSPEIDLITAIAAELSFNHFLESESEYDFARVSIIHAEGTTEVLSSHGSGLPVATSGFENVRFDLRAFLGQTIQVAFQFTSDGSIVNEGWYVDDVIVRAELPVVDPVKPDLVGVAFDAVTDHVIDLQTDVTFTIANIGAGDASAFAAHVVWSANDIVGDSDDVVVPNSEVLFTSGLAAGEIADRTVRLELDPAMSFMDAASADPFGVPVGAMSTEASQLFLIVDSGHAVVEEDESNNSGIGKLTDSDDITYFPSDTNGDGVVTPLEVLDIVRAVGTDAVEADFDRDGLVTALEALYGLQRIGARINGTVIETTGQTFGSSFSSSASLSAASVAPATALPVYAEESEAPVAESEIVMSVLDDEEERRLFNSTEAESHVKPSIHPPDDTDFVDGGFESGVDWLSLI